MAVYVDQIKDYGGKVGRWSHMWADTLDELHEMADKIGLKRRWFQRHRVHPHYDVRPTKRALAVRHGAIETTSRELAKMILDYRRKKEEA